MEFRKKVVAQVEEITGKAEAAFTTDEKKQIRLIMKHWDLVIKRRFNPPNAMAMCDPLEFRFQGKTVIISQ